MLFVVFNKWVPKGFAWITIFPFVFVAQKKWLQDATFISHERIHLRQQIEMLILPFFIWYGVEFLFRMIQYRNRKKAYRNISFEDRKSTRLNSSHVKISYAVFCLKKKNETKTASDGSSRPSSSRR